MNFMHGLRTVLPEICVEGDTLQMGGEEVGEEG